MRKVEAERRARKIVFDRGGEWHDGALNGLDLEQLCQILADEFADLEPAHREPNKKHVPDGHPKARKRRWTTGPGSNTFLD
jgi:hypothetical protein